MRTDSPILRPDKNRATTHSKGKKTGNKQIDDLKKGIWVYFWLVILEGALRKWVLPQLATPLLIIRDPVALWLIFKAYNQGKFTFNGYITVTWVVTIIAIITAVVAGHGSIGVAIYGARIMILHFPVLFIIGNTFTRDDVLAMGRMTMWTVLPMTLLVGLQFYSPQGAWVNRGVGGDMAGAGFSGAMGYFRPPGTFSFTNGLVTFYGLAIAFVFYFWLDKSKAINKLLLMAATGGVIVALPLSISRTYLFELVLSGLFTVIAAARNPKIFGKIIVAAIAVVCLMFVISKASFFQTGTAAFNERLTTANEAEGGSKAVIVDRILGGMTVALTAGQGLPLFGFGLGLGTNAGAKLATGSTSFVFGAEAEWGRIIGEMGLLLGIFVVLARSGLSISLLTRSFKAIGSGNLLPWLLMSFVFINLSQGQWGQPTSQGFAVLAAGLVYAGLKKPKRLASHEDNLNF